MKKQKQPSFISDKELQKKAEQYFPKSKFKIIEWELSILRKLFVHGFRLGEKFYFKRHPEKLQQITNNTKPKKRNSNYTKPKKKKKKH